MNDFVRIRPSPMVASWAKRSSARAPQQPHPPVAAPPATGGEAVAPFSLIVLRECRSGADDALQDAGAVTDDDPLRSERAACGS